MSLSISHMQPWVVKMLRAHEDGVLVLLENLDPSYTSSEIEVCMSHSSFLQFNGPDF